jgi:hypothetical protein
MWPEQADPMQNAAHDPFGDSPATPGRLTEAAMKWAGAVLSVVLLGAIGLWTYELGRRDASAVPVIRALEGPAKEQPEDPGGLKAEHQGLSVNRIVEGTPPPPRPEGVTLAPAPAAPAPEDIAPDAEPPDVTGTAPSGLTAPVAEPPLAGVAAPAAPAAPMPAEGQTVALPAAPAPVAAALPRPQQSAPPEETRPAASLDPAPVASAPAPADEQGTIAFGAEEAEEGPARARVPAGIEPAAAAAVAAALPSPTPQSPELLPQAPPPPETPGTAVSAAAPARSPMPPRRPATRPAGTEVAAAEAAPAGTLLPAASPAAAAPSPGSADPALPPKGTQLIQLGAFESPDVARAEWQKLIGQHGDLLGQKGPVVQRTVSSGRVFFRLRAEGFADLSDARATCAALVARGAACITARQE